MLKLEKTKSELYTVKYNNKYLHSKYDPLEESKKFINKYKNLIEKSSIILIYGLGLGYHVEQVFNINNKVQIYVFEGNEELINVCKKTNFKLFCNKRINIISYKERDFYSIFSKVIKGVKDIIVHRPSLQTIKYSNKELYALINNYIISKQAVDNSGMLEENYKENFKQCYSSIHSLIKQFNKENKPYIITAAGPSLDDELEILKNNRKNFIVITVGTALKSLMNNNIKPDIIVIIDGKKPVANQLSGFENENISLCFLSTASRWAVKGYKGPKYIFFNAMGEDEIIIETGKTVAVAAMNIAIKCGAKEVVLLGQDLAYLNGKSHISAFKDIYNCEDNPIINEQNDVVKGVDGKMLKTTKGYIYFKNQIENVIKKNLNVNFVNCSKGALIKGAKNIDFKQYLSKLFCDISI
ncbi:motility associated factor glycosyltransferase family protein [Clostridium niameyense]|uniref:motility associated factor glycosyltransferase family protein n=1 Tax=Clostridium niameyense TaxID=1622073 RepID=UPI00067F0F11|nr:6-hydroxymethylpterin diphosphokinase MptE-like protein [Clostridium niameyense]